MRFSGALIFGFLALVATLFSVVWHPAFGGLLLIGSLPLWLLFILFLLRAGRGR